MHSVFYFILEQPEIRVRHAHLDKWASRNKVINAWEPGITFLAPMNWRSVMHAGRYLLDVLWPQPWARYPETQFL